MQAVQTDDDTANVATGLQLNSNADSLHVATQSVESQNAATDPLVSSMNSLEDSATQTFDSSQGSQLRNEDNSQLQFAQQPSQQVLEFHLQQEATQPQQHQVSPQQQLLKHKSNISALLQPNSGPQTVGPFSFGSIMNEAGFHQPRLELPQISVPPENSSSRIGGMNFAFVGNICSE